VNTDAYSPAVVGRRVLVTILLLTGVAIIASSDVLHQLALRAVDAAAEIISARPVIGMSAFIVFAAISAMLAFFSSAVLVPVGVQVWGKPLTTFLLWGGWTLGGMCAYTIGRLFGRSIAGFFVSSEALGRFERRISTGTPIGLVLLFQLAVPSEVPGYVLGLGRYSFAKYLIVVTVGELPFAIGTIYLGESFLERRTFLLIAIGASGALFSAWALYMLQRRLTRTSVRP
jgi:uncharacterized membrane protein YdjX (TVP38/TMEM64 family)